MSVCLSLSSPPPLSLFLHLTFSTPPSLPFYSTPLPFLSHLFCNRPSLFLNFPEMIKVPLLAISNNVLVLFENKNWFFAYPFLWSLKKNDNYRHRREGPWNRNFSVSWSSFSKSVYIMLFGQNHCLQLLLSREKYFIGLLFSVSISSILGLLFCGHSLSIQFLFSFLSLTNSENDILWIFWNKFTFLWNE